VATEEDVLSCEYRKSVLDEICTVENDYRKNESRRRFEVYNNNIHEFVKDELVREYDYATVEKFRTQTSINLVPKVINEQASIYKNSPKRNFYGLTEDQEQYVLDKYDNFRYDISLKKSNKYFKLQDQGLLQIIPNSNMELKARFLQPHHYDVIPSDDDVTKPMAVIINLLNEQRFISTYQDSTERKTSRDFMDGKIADWDDQRRFKARFTWYTDNYNFITNGFGDIVSDESDIENSLGELPFIEIADEAEKDFRYWIFRESLLTRFQLDFCKDLTDLAETIKMQGFAMGILFAKNKPESVNVGPRKFMYIPLDPDNPELKPQFDFKNPSPNIVAQMNVILDKIAMFLSSYGIDPKSVGGVTNVQEFNSGVQMLLAQIKRFEASNDDLQLFKWVEQKLFKKFIKWNNLMATNGIDGYQVLPEEAEVMVNYVKPQAIETQKEKEDRYIRLIENGLSSRVRAIMDIEEVDRETAEKIIIEIDQNEGMINEVV